MSDSKPTFKAFLQTLSAQGGVLLGDTFYPETFTVNGHQYRWNLSQNRTKGTSMSLHWELWGHGDNLPSACYATGDLTAGKVKKFLKAVYDRNFG